MSIHQIQINVWIWATWLLSIVHNRIDTWRFSSRLLSSFWEIGKNVCNSRSASHTDLLNCLQILIKIHLLLFETSSWQTDNQAEAISIKGIFVVMIKKIRIARFSTWMTLFFSQNKLDYFAHSCEVVLTWSAQRIWTLLFPCRWQLACVCVCGGVKGGGEGGL